MQEIILKSDGNAVLRTITEQPCAIVNELVEGLSNNAIRSLPGIFQTPTERVGVVLTRNEILLGCRLSHLELSMNWFLSNGLLLPRPCANGDKGSGTVMKMKWEPHNGLNLMFVAVIHPGMEIENRKCFLLAFNSSKANYQLPLPNLYDDCSVCMGEFNSHGTSYLECFQKALTQFRNATWNTDLTDGEKLKKLETLIRFKVVKQDDKDVFEREGNGNLWWNQCWSRETRVTDAARRLL